jgi:hypothetical protein
MARVVPAVLAVCAAAAVAMLLVRPTAHPEEFAARGAPADADPQVFVYRVADRGAAGLTSVRLDARGATIGAGDDLAFAYTNPRGYRHLLVFGVDEHRHVQWYYPAWTNAADDPPAFDVGAAETERELPEAIVHDLDGSELTIYAVFLDGETSVTRVEQQVGAMGAVGEPLPIQGAFQQRTTLHVAR